jgi:kynurenine formamidase
LPNGDLIITADSISALFKPQANVDALIIRTLPNTSEKLNKQYSGANPPYLHHEAAQYCCASGIKHLLLDLPSVDREDDGGVLSAHHAFWQYPHKTRKEATITELIYVPNIVADGLYMLNLQIASFENDASPSKPLLFELQKP